jgi:hypothetical protein
VGHNILLLAFVPTGKNSMLPSNVQCFLTGSYIIDVAW